MSGVESRVPIGLDRETSRRNFLKTAAITGAALSAMGIGGFGVAVRRAEAEGEYKTYEGLGDAAIVAFAYQLELLEGTFYAEGVKAGIFKDAFLEQIVAIRDHEMAHADALATTLGQLGAEVPATPQFTFPGGTFGDAATFLELAATFEPVGHRSLPGRGACAQEQGHSGRGHLDPQRRVPAPVRDQHTEPRSTRRTTSPSRRLCPCRRCRRP